MQLSIHGIVRTSFWWPDVLHEVNQLGLGRGAGIWQPVKWKLNFASVPCTKNSRDYLKNSRLLNREFIWKIHVTCSSRSHAGLTFRTSDPALTRLTMFDMVTWSAMLSPCEMNINLARQDLPSHSSLAHRSPSPWPSGIGSRLGRNRLWARFPAVSDIYPMFTEPTITWAPSGFSGYIWLDTKIVLKKKKKKRIYYVQNMESTIF